MRTRRCWSWRSPPESSAPVTLERARSLVEARRDSSAGAFDAVLLDLGLPDSSGLETFRRLHSAAGDTPIVVLTASDDDGLAVGAVHAGAQDYLVKSSTDAAAARRARCAMRANGRGSAAA